jgi:hypothetical protein
MARKQQDNAPAPAAQPAYKVVKREKDRGWEVRDQRGEGVCVTVYKRGAVEVLRRSRGALRKPFRESTVLVQFSASNRRHSA